MNRINTAEYDYNIPAVEALIGDGAGDFNDQNSNTVAMYLAKAAGLENGVMTFITENGLHVPGYLSKLEHSGGEVDLDRLVEGLETAIGQNRLNFYEWAKGLSETYQISIATIYQEIGMKIGEKKAISTSENETFKGANEYLFSYSNFGNDVIDNSNELNNTDKEIHIGNDQLKGLALTTATNNYRLGNYMLTKTGAGNFEIGTDIIIKPVNTSYNDSILIKNFKQGDYGIYFLEETAKQSGTSWNTLFTKLSEITGNTPQQLLNSTGNLFSPMFGLWQVNQGVNSIPGLGYTGDMAQWFIKSLGNSLRNGIYGIYGLLNNGGSAAIGINGNISGALNQVGSMRRDPLMLDLDGDGLELVQLNQSGVFFDLDGDGRAEHTAWVKEDDGFLAIDENRDGRINDIQELLGDNRQSGFTELRGLDSNSDGKITIADQRFSELSIWQDRNQNGQTDSGELRSLASWGITEIQVGADQVTGVGAWYQGSFIAEQSRYRQFGQERSIFEVFLTVDASNAQISNERFLLGDYFTLHPDAVILPKSRGYGQLPAWHLAFTQNETLRELAKEMVNLAPERYTELDEKMEMFLYEWAGATGVDPASRGVNWDARKIAVLEKLRGEILGQAVPGEVFTLLFDWMIPALNQAWQTVYETFKNRFLVQGTFKTLFTDTDYYFQSDTVVIKGDLSDILEKTQEKALAMGAEGVALWVDVRRILLENAGHSNLNIAQIQSEIMDYLKQWLPELPIDSSLITGTNQADWRPGSAGNDWISGLSGEDYLLGDSGNDILSGDGGNDTMAGGPGADHYLYRKGDGQDRIMEEGNDIDVIRLPDSDADEVRFSTNGTDMVIYLENAPDQKITIANQLSGIDTGKNTVEFIRFANGAVRSLRSGFEWTIEPEKPYFQGSAQAEKIIGRSAGEELRGGRGNDTMIGNAGDDTLQGDEGSDEYQFSLGDGKDTIREWNSREALDFLFDASQSADTFFERHAHEEIDRIRLGAGIRLEDLRFTRNGNDLEIQINEENRMTIKDQYYEPGKSRIEGLIDENGRLLNLLTVPLRIESNAMVWQPAYGASGNDILIGGSGDNGLRGAGGNDMLLGGNGNDDLDGGDGNDMLVGEKGNDLVSGGLGADQYSFNLGDGSDRIREVGTDTDQLILGPGITWDMLRFERNWQDNLIIHITDTDKIEILEFFKAGKAIVEELVLSDGSSHSLTAGFEFNGTDNQDQLTGSSYADTMRGFDEGDRLDGHGGNDWLQGGKGGDNLNGNAGDDLLEGGDGADVLYGEQGNDTLDGNGYEITQNWWEQESLYGGDGNDTYIWGAGYGNTYIEESDGPDSDQDRIELKPGLLISDLAIIPTQNQGSVMILNPANGERIFIRSHFLGSDNQVEYLVDSQGNTLNLSTLREFKTTATESNVGGSADADTIWGGKGSDNIQGWSGNDWISGGENGDHLQGEDGDDTLLGGNHSDHLKGGNGNDWLEGGTDNDQLTGGAGEDIYVFNLGDGVDTLFGEWQHSDTDIIQFGPEITPDDIQLGRIPNGVWWQSNQQWGITVKETEGILIENQWNQVNPAIEILRFANGQEIRLDGIALDGWLTGSTDADYLISRPEANQVLGRGGNDQLETGSWNTIFTGGAGNDQFIFHKGYGQVLVKGSADDGNDTLIMEDGLTPDDVSIQLQWNDLIIQVKGSGDSVKLEGFREYLSTEKIRFSNGAEMDLTAPFRIEGAQTANMLEGTQRADELLGYDGKDTLEGNGGDDYLDGGAGDDLVKGGQGNDRYYFGLGSGNDTLMDNGGIDTLVLGEGISLSDLRWRTTAGDWTDRTIEIKDGSDSIRIQKNTSPGINNIEWLEFADGTRMALDKPPEFFKYGTEHGPYVLGSIGADTIRGTTGTEVLIGDRGSDTYYLGRSTGADTVWEAEYADTDIDTIEVEAGITASDLRFQVEWGDDLKITIKESGNMIWILDQFPYGERTAYGIEELVFADGSRINLKSGVLIEGSILNDSLTGHSGNDTINGGAGADSLTGNDGDDHLIGEDGNDTLYGGKGLDTLEGSAGDDLLYGEDGSDILRGGDGLDLLYGRAGNDLLQGGAGDDVLTADSGDDTLQGGSGNDALYGGDGSDGYWFEKGWGQDRIIEVKNSTLQNHILLGPGISFADLIFSREIKGQIQEILYMNEEDIQDNLVIRLRDSQDRIEIQGQFNLINQKITEKIQFLQS